MVKSGKGRGLQFGILGAATVALLGLFLWRGSGETPSAKTSLVRTAQAPAPQIVPVQAPLVSEGITPEVRAIPGEAIKTAPEAGPIARAEAATPPAEDDKTLHPGERADSARVVALHGEEPLTAEHPHVAAAIKIQERHPELLAHAGVVGTAVGLNDKAEIALIVYTKVEVTDLPLAIEGLPVAAWVSGEFSSRNRFTKQDVVTTRDQITPHAKPQAGPPSSVDRTAKYRPAPLGVSTGHPAITAGTIGCRLKNGTAVFALSNNHVYANQNRAGIGDAVIQPGTYDGGSSPADDIGTLSDYEPLNFSADGSGTSNTIDAAIAASSTGNLGKATPPDGYGIPSSAIAAPAISLKVKKYGRTTGQTSGKIQSINATVNVGYDPGSVARFFGQVVINPGNFSAGGDSGSLIVTQSGDSPVGLLFAGSSSSTIANPIGAVLNRFSPLTIDGK